MGLVLVVDDKEMLRDSVGATLTRAGLEVVTADSVGAAVAQIARRRPDAVVTDLKMPGGSGVDLLKQVVAFDDELPVILMTAFGTIETAVEALKLGAFDYLTKPFEGDELVIAVKRAIEHGRLVKENQVLRACGAAGTGSAAGSGVQATARADVTGGSGGLRGLDRLVGESAAMRRVKEQVLAVAESQGNVLICGESGTGKEVVARAVHDLSPRGGGPFLAVNCAALSESLLESELFGHERGAFTGAEKLRKGRFELADRGTLLLDEISEVSTHVQAKLLRVLQERSFERVGSSAALGVDVRVIATSNQDLPRAVAAGRFRQDLFFRLNVLPIHMPPLRDRPEDVPALARHFVALLAAREGRAAPVLEPSALSALSAYSWPGNVRELQNICERALVLSRGRPISADLLSPWLSAGSGVGTGSAQPQYAQLLSVVNGHAGPGGTASANGHHTNGVGGNGQPHGYAEAKPGAMAGTVAILDRALEDIERDAIVQTLQRMGGHRQRTAQALGIGVRTLGLKLKKWKTLSLVEPSL
jgi:DNA-binding NtrC family response regulator